MGILNDGLNAMISNNLAMTMVRIGLDEERGARAKELAEDATRMQSQVSSYWGTRGWVDLELGELDDALGSFRSCVRLDPESPEGWVGVLIASSGLGDEREEEAQEALERVRAFHKAENLSTELLSYLRVYGLSELDLQLAP